jgi:hypothetical protein
VGQAEIDTHLRHRAVLEDLGHESRRKGVPLIYAKSGLLDLGSRDGRGVIRDAQPFFRKRIGALLPRRFDPRVGIRLEAMSDRRDEIPRRGPGN